MAILSIDSCLQSCSAAILVDDVVQARRSEWREKGHVERLAPLVREVLDEADIAVCDLTRVVVTVGPGSFAGVRVGLAFARGLAIGHELPVVGVTTLEALISALPGDQGACRVALIDARRGQVYGQVFAASELKPVTEPFVLTPEQARLHLEESLAATEPVLTGTGVPFVFPERANDADWAGQQPDPVVIARIGMRKPRPVEAPQAVYLRPADAKPAKPAFS